MALFGKEQDAAFVRGINRELMGDIISQQAAFYKFKVKETNVNLYGESSGKKFYDGPFLFNCLIDREDQKHNLGDEGVKYSQVIQFRFLRDDLLDANIYPEIGDIILYQESYFEVEGVVKNQYFLGKNPDYPNNNSDGTDNPINPDLNLFGASISIVCNTHKIPSDKVSITPYKERL